MKACNAAARNRKQTWLANKRDYLAVAFLLTLVIGLYWQTGQFDFLNLNDPHYVFANPYIRDGLTWSGIKWAFSAQLLFPSAYADDYQPLTFLSRMLDLQIHGTDAGGHHVTNLLFHAINSALVFGVLDRMTREYWPSLTVAMIFVVHPLQVESVAWVTQRNNLLVAFFSLLTFWGYVRFTERPSVPRYMAVFALFLLAILSKPPMAVMLPLILVLLDYWPLNRLPQNPFHDGPSRRLLAFRFLEKLPLLAISCAAAMVTLQASIAGGAVSTLASLPPTLRVGNALASYAAYLGKVVWPVHLSILYPYPMNGVPLPWVGGSFAVLALISWWVLRQGQRGRYLMTGWGWYLITLLPVIGLIQVGRVSMADRFLYLPLVGLLVMASWGAWQWAVRSERRTQLTLAGAVALTACFALATLRTLPAWRNSTALFSQAVRVTSDNYLAHSALGSALASEGKLAEAIPQFAEAVRIHPGFVGARYKLALALQQRRQFTAAIGELQRVLQQLTEDAEQGLPPSGAAQELPPELSETPQPAQVYCDLGRAWIELRDFKVAAEQFGKAIQLAPTLAEAYLGRSVAFARQGRTVEALEDAMRCLKRKPEYAEAHYNLGLLHAGRGELIAAKQDFSEAAGLQPGFAEAYNELGSVLVRLNHLDQALAQFAKAIELQPRLASARNNMAVALLRLGRNAEAIEHLTEALRIDPHYEDARENLRAAHSH